MRQALPHAYSVNLTSVDVPPDSGPGHYRSIVTVTMVADSPAGTLSAQVRECKCAQSQSCSMHARRWPLCKRLIAWPAVMHRQLNLIVYKAGVKPPPPLIDPVTEPSAKATA